MSATARDQVAIYAVGLGRAASMVPAGSAFTGAAPTVNPVQVLLTRPRQRRLSRELYQQAIRSTFKFPRSSVPRIFRQLRRLGKLLKEESCCRCAGKAGKRLIRDCHRRSRCQILPRPARFSSTKRRLDIQHQQSALSNLHVVAFPSIAHLVPERKCSPNRQNRAEKTYFHYFLV